MAARKRSPRRAQTARGRWPILLRSPRAVVRALRRREIEAGLFDQAAQLAFWMLLSVFPLLLSLLVIFGYVVEERVELRRDLFASVERVAPDPAIARLLRDVLEQVQTRRDPTKLSLGILIALWAGSTALFELHRIIDRELGEQRRFPLLQRLRALPAAFLVGLPLFAAVLLVFYGRLATGRLAAWLGDAAASVAGFWEQLALPLLLVSLLLAFDLVYSSAAAARRHGFRLLSPGSFLVVGSWLALSFALRYYLRTAADFTVLYGSLAVVIVLLFWLFLTACSLVAGVRLNAAIDRSAG